MTGWLAALLGALPELVRVGVAAFRQRRAELSPVVEPTHKRIELDDDAEITRRERATATPVGK